ncbi:hypothetical protein GNF80_12785 [Clostridium perfringens]|nr:hypothetical protein [Clostridium perfringens]
MRSRINKVSNRIVATLGIKNLDNNLESILVNIINCNPKYIVLGCRELPFTDKGWEVLNNVNCPKIVISPFNYMFRNQREVVNEIKFIENFSKNNIGTILNSINEANFILTDKFCYISSGSLNCNGITNNVELYEAMNLNDSNYKLWRDEILDFINQEIENYRSTCHKEKIEYILEELKKRLVINTSNNPVELTKDYIYILLDILENVERFTMIGTDVYQYLNKDFVELIKLNKKFLTKSNSIKGELFKMLLNIEENKEQANIKVFNSLRDGFSILIEELEQLKNLREIKYYNSNEAWRKDEGIIAFLSENTNINNSLIKEFYEKVLLEHHL